MKPEMFGVDDLPVPVFEIKYDGKLKYVNNSARKKFGYSAGDVEGVSIFNFIHKSQHKKLKDRFNSLLKNVKSSSSEYTAVKKNGRTFPVLINSKRKVKNGEMSVVGTIIDLSSQKKAESNLEQTKRKYVDLFENSVEGLYQSGKTGRIQKINTSFARLFGFNSKEELLDNIKNIKQLYVDKDKRSDFNDLIKQDGFVGNFEYRAYKKDKTIIWVSEDTRTVYDSDGKFQYYAGSLTDITSKKEFEEKLKKANERTNNLNNFIQSVIDGISDEILVIDPKSRKIIYGNNKVLKRTGFELEELQGKKCHEVYNGSSSCPSCGAKDIKDSKLEYEHQAYDKNGNVIYRNISCYPLVDKKGNVERFVHVAKDITKKKKYENQLKELTQRLLKIYQTSTSLQKALNISKIYEIALETFESFGFERIRIYSYKNNYLHGEVSNYLDNKEFKKLYFPVVKHNEKAYNCITYKKPIIESTRGKRKISEFLKKPEGLQNGSLPLISENKVIGMISFDNYYTKKPLVKKDLELLMTFANQIASSIERARIQQENLNQLNKLSTLYEISSAISQTLDLQKILNMVSIRLVKLLKVDRCSIFLLDDEREKFIKESIFDIKENNPRIHKPSMEKSITSSAIKENRIIYVEDTSKHSKYKDYWDVMAKSFKSFISIPLNVENKAIGVININTRGKRVFSSDEIDLIRALSSHVSMIIENSRLYERIKHDKDNFSALLNLTQETNKLHDLDSLINEMLKHTVSLTGSDHGFILLKDEEHLELTASEGRYSKEQLRFKIGSGIAGTVAKKGRTIIVSDCKKEKNYLPIDDEIKSCASIPLIKKGNVMGVLHLESKRKNNFKFFEKSLMVLTNHITISIENIRLYEKVLNFNKELEKRIDEATKELQEKNIELQKMDQMKSDFVSNVSHELRTPLTSISGYTKLLNMGKLGELNEQQKNVVSIIISESDRLSRLINDVLDLSKLEAGKIEVTFEKIDVREVFESTIQSLKSMASEKKISIRTKYGKNVDSIDASYDLLKQVLINLLSNALKFTPKKGKITLQANVKGKNLVIQVKDNGKGIRKEEIPKLFNRFYQVDSSMTREHGGTGLGLVIVKHIIEMHKGKIEVESEVDKGSNFIVTMPIKQDNKKENYVAK